MRRVVVLALLAAALAAGCGDDRPSAFRQHAEQACRDFDRDGFHGPVSVKRARSLYARLGRAIAADRAATDEERRARDALARFAEAGVELFGQAPEGVPPLDLKSTASARVSDIVAVRKAGLPACVDVIKGEAAS